MHIVGIDEIPKLEDIKDVLLSDTASVYKTCRSMEILCDTSEGIGLSAVQVGIPWKLFIVKSDGGCPFIRPKEYGYFVNCEYEPVTDEQVVSLEGCLSVRSPEGQLRLFQVNRYTKIKIYGFRLIINDSNNMDFVPIDFEVAFHEQGVVFQHEIDHHRGKLVSDIGKEVFLW